MDRRRFIKLTAAALTIAPAVSGGSARAATAGSSGEGRMGCLVDTTKCIGCRKCEQACNERHGLPRPKESFAELAVLENHRRMDEHSYTVVNKFYPKNIGDLIWRQRPVFVKSQCMHCNDPSCVSACIVGALTKQANGAVVYDAAKCIGCRYCMVACPFQVPAYEYNEALTPQVRKCDFCFDFVKGGGLPACAQACPREAITFGPRDELLRLAQWKMRTNPGKYVDHIYGQYEVGGTSWLYLAAAPFSTLGFPKLGKKAPPRLTESIQHAMVGDLIFPLSLYALLGGTMWLTGFLKKAERGRKDEPTDRRSDS